MDGRKDDSEKPRTDLLPPRAILAVAEVLAFGARKYDPENWRKVPGAKWRYVGAALRHTLAFMGGERLDTESGKHHLACASTSLLFVLELDILGENP